ncbi:MFS general substrate transporter [Lepidopterella palustris CBS 459.81]|uniref:MFS general substrate transporter n=1 Tax=Lepidopterella palustris CBS 459.81 TaxID=1314670 RepID=A0A8E2EDR3_9PEZI|nr:MFS general substrate transporter [Lepidopterella palustris CBS 459.81]
MTSSRQHLRDLFRWKVRVVQHNKNGEVQVEYQSPTPLHNPIRLLRDLHKRDGAMCLVALAAYTADAFDFHSVATQVEKLAWYYNSTYLYVSGCLAISMVTRYVGAAIMGLAGDRYGRKWPMIFSLWALGALQIGSIYCGSLYQFMAVRATIGLVIGGLYGNAMAMALENCPTHSRGLMSGILQAGYPLGYILAASASMGSGASLGRYYDMNTTESSLRIVFGCGSIFSFAVGAIRMLIGESYQFVEAKRQHRRRDSERTFWNDAIHMLRNESSIMLYSILLMTCFNYLGHTSQDNYTSFLRTSRDMDWDVALRGGITMMVGAVVGSVTLGYISQWIGRRRTVIGACIITAFMIPAYILPDREDALSVSGFFLQFFLQGAWGIVPVHLNELSHPSFRAFMPGFTIQIGALLAAPSSYAIIKTAHDHRSGNGRGYYKEARYGRPMGIAIAISLAAIVLLTALGPERRYRHFENALPAGCGDRTGNDEEGGHRDEKHNRHNRDDSRNRRDGRNRDDSRNRRNRDESRNRRDRDESRNRRDRDESRNRRDRDESRNRRDRDESRNRRDSDESRNRRDRDESRNRRERNGNDSGGRDEGRDLSNGHRSRDSSRSRNDRDQDNRRRQNFLRDSLNPPVRHMGATYLFKQILRGDNDNNHGRHNSRNLFDDDATEIQVLEPPIKI